MTKFEVPTWEANAIGDNACKEAFKHKSKLTKSGKIKKAKTKKTLPIKQNIIKKRINSVKNGNDTVNVQKGSKQKRKKSPNPRKESVQEYDLQNQSKNKDSGGGFKKSQPKNNAAHKKFKVKDSASIGVLNDSAGKKNKGVQKDNSARNKIQVKDSASVGVLNTPVGKKRKKKNKGIIQSDSSTGVSDNASTRIEKDTIESQDDSTSAGIFDYAINKEKKNKLPKTNGKIDSLSVNKTKKKGLKNNKKRALNSEGLNGSEGTSDFVKGNKKLMDKVREKVKLSVVEKSGKTKWQNLPLRERMVEKLKAARFRYLNEEIYTNTGSDAVKFFKSDPSAFKAYHEGYRQQVERWPLNPLDSIIAKIKKMPKNIVIADFGCGEGRLAESVSQKVHSFDIVAANEKIIACDMANVPLEKNSVDVVVFCLSLMGTNLIDYLYEANRVLKSGGTLIIAEVESRFDTVETFVAGVERVGFKNMWKDLSHNLFYFLDFKKMTDVKNKKKLPTISLHPCLYKKR